MVLRVVSLLPSATEKVYLCTSNADPESSGSVEFVGRSHECDYPPCLSHLPVLTAAKTRFTDSADVERQVREALAAGKGLYTVDKELLQSLRPDVIITQSVCSVCSVDYCLVESIASGLSPAPRVIDLNPSSLDDVLIDLERVGAELGLAAAASRAAAALRARVAAARDVADEALAAGKQPVRCAFLEWTDPIYPGGHWTPQLIHMAGGSHEVNPPKGDGLPANPSAAIHADKLVAAMPDVMIIGPCGLDLPTTRREVLALERSEWWAKLPAVRNRRVYLVDGNQHFNRPGPRLVDALEFLVGLFHDRPELIPSDFPYERWAA